jgi:hypothetical protein
VRVKADKNMIGGMDQHSLMDYQDEARELGRIMSLSINDIPKAFFIVETALEVRAMLCGTLSQEENDNNSMGGKNV